MAIFNSYVSLPEGNIPHIQDQRVMAMLGTVPEISRDPVQFVPRLVGPRKVSWFIQFTSVIYSQWISWSTYKRLNIWLVVWNIAFVFHHIWDVTVSFPLTNSYLSRWLKPPTRCIIYIYIEIHYIRWIWSLYIWHMMTSYTLPLTFWPNPRDLRTSMSLVIRTMAGAAFTTVLVLYKHATRRRVQRFATSSHAYCSFRALILSVCCWEGHFTTKTNLFYWVYQYWSSVSPCFPSSQF